MPQFAILIEDTAQVRERIGAEKKAKFKYQFPDGKYDIQQVNSVALFQYMIGNEDWSIRSLRNVKLLLRKDTFLLIPYDFDFAGFVNAPYAIVSSTLGVSSPQDRVYLGIPADMILLGLTIGVFERKKWKFKRVIRRCKLLDRKNKKVLLRYIKSFYKSIGYITIPKEGYIY